MKYAFMICLLMAGVAFAGSHDADLMPEGFEKIHIGMDWRSLLSLRSNTEILNMMPNPGEDLKPDPEKPKSGLFEKLPGNAYGVVYYFFEEEVLVAVMFGKEKGRFSSGERKKVIRKTAQERGMPTRIGIVGNRHDQGVLTWQDQTLHINVMVPTDDADPTGSVIGLQIMNLEYAERIKAIGVSDDAKKDKDLQGADKQRLETLKSEIKALLSVKDSSPQN